MSTQWDSYVAEFLKVPGVTSAALLDKNPAALSVWASSKDFSTDTACLHAVVKDFGTDGALALNGITLKPGFKYMTTSATPEFVHGKKNAEGVMLFATKTGIIVVTYGSDAVPGTVSAGISKYADYLIGMNV
ncbi:profilin, required for normal timing of actin polymerization in response to thermal stress [Coemansia javaensis]|uniref:Profilin n=1 Tax=Coemansia javaensis TaxID=2761396 RepID=A0A9W8LGY0_9FUNG|nr:profilin, required for normal timing of actin polymerization in response to thermal stress [Coemansia javaensis]